MNDFWDVVFAQQASKECFGCLSITVFLQEDVKHSALFVHRPPEPVFNSTNDNVHLIQMPPGTPTGFPVTSFLSQEWGEFDVPLAKGFVDDVNSSLVEQLLNITLAEREAVVEPQGVPNDTQRKTVTIGLTVSHSLSPDQAVVLHPVQHPAEAGLFHHDFYHSPVIARWPR